MEDERITDDIRYTLCHKSGKLWCFNRLRIQTLPIIPRIVGFVEKMKRQRLKHHNIPDLWHRVYRLSSVIFSSSIIYWTLIYFHFNRVCVLFVTATIVTSPLEGWELKMNSQEKENRKKSVDCSTPAQGSQCSSNVGPVMYCAVSKKW